MPVRQSFCYPLFKQKDQSLPELFAEAKAIGYEATELWAWDESLDEIHAQAKEAGLRIASICGHQSLEDGLNKRENHDRIESELRTSIDKAAQLEIPGLICFTGERNVGQTDYDGMVACAEGLKRVTAYAEDKGVNLNVELLNSKVDHHLYQADHSEWGIALCRLVDSPRMGLLFDVYHMQVMEGDVIASLRRCGDLVKHVHTAGVPGRHDIDDSQELNYRAICRALLEMGYDLYVGHELMTKKDRATALRESFEVCSVDR